MTHDISQLLIFNPDLTIGGYFKLFPEPVEYECITLQSAFNKIEEVKPKVIKTARGMAKRNSKEYAGQIDLLTAYRSQFLQAKRMRRY